MPGRLPGIMGPGPDTDAPFICKQVRVQLCAAIHQEEVVLMKDVRQWQASRHLASPCNPSTSGDLLFQSP